MTFLQEATFRLEKRLVVHESLQCRLGVDDHTILASDGHANGKEGNDNNIDNDNDIDDDIDDGIDDDTTGGSGELTRPLVPSRPGPTTTATGKAEPKIFAIPAAKMYNAAAAAAAEGQQESTGGGGKGGNRIIIAGGGFASERFSDTLEGSLGEGVAGGSSRGGGSGGMHGRGKSDSSCDDRHHRGEKHKNNAPSDNFLGVINRARGVCSDDSNVFGAWDS